MSNGSSIEPLLIAASIVASHANELGVDWVYFEGDRNLVTIGSKVFEFHQAWSVSQIIESINDSFGLSLPKVHDNSHFPDEPIPAEDKWAELLRDLGETKSSLTDRINGARYVSVVRTESAAIIECAQEQTCWTWQVPLRDGSLPVGTNDDVVYEFGHSSPKPSE